MKFKFVMVDASPIKRVEYNGTGALHDARTICHLSNVHGTIRYHSK